MITFSPKSLSERDYFGPFFRETYLLNYDKTTIGFPKIGYPFKLFLATVA